jgi:predicted DNA-binding transcriptional regulator AlpA
MSDTFWTIDDLAARMRTTVSAIYMRRLRKPDTLPPPFPAGGRALVWLPSAVEEWEKRRANVMPIRKGGRPRKVV